MSIKNYRPNKGFSLLEMTVVLAIVGIMTAIVLMNLPQMKGGMSIDVVAQEVAIYVRGAQVYSRATKIDVDAVSGGKGYNSYGLHFSSLPSERASFFLWADKNGTVTLDKNNPDYVYNEPISDEASDGDGKPQEVYTLPSGFYISKLFCGNDVKDKEISFINKLDIVFKLPDPEANFGSQDVDSGGFFKPCEDMLFAGICLTSANLAQSRLIKTFSNGQIMVENPLGLEYNPCAEK